jgi:hypothetical protein
MGILLYNIYFLFYFSFWHIFTHTHNIYIYINKVKNPTNIEEFERIEYIYERIIPIIEFEILNIYFRTRVVDGILG